MCSSKAALRNWLYRLHLLPLFPIAFNLPIAIFGGKGFWLELYAGFPLGFHSWGLHVTGLTLMGIVLYTGLIVEFSDEIDASKTQ
jgi:hypothetical protein